MKYYEKPVALANEELAESVYTSSGSGNGCYTYITYSADNTIGNPDYYHYTVKFRHSDVQHNGLTHKFIIIFSEVPESVGIYGNGNGQVTVDGISGHTVTVTYTRSGNPGNTEANIDIQVKWAGTVGCPTGGYGWVE